MAASNVLIFILVWTFTAVCQADDGISVNCEDVTGTVGEEVTFSCSVSLEKSYCCITVFKFQYPETYNDPTICREVFPPDSCEQRNSFTCRFSSTTVMSEQFRFFVQTTCGQKYTEFTVNTTETSKPEPVTEDPETIKHLKWDTEVSGHGSKVIGSAAVVGSSIAVIIILITVITGMTIFCVKRFKRNNPPGFQMNYERSASADPTMMTVNVQSETK